MGSAYAGRVRRLITLPGEGTLLVATDLHGNLADFHAIATLFETLTSASPAGGNPVHLVLTGDLLHGPLADPEDWPEHLGTYYRDESPELLRAAQQLQRNHPGRVHYLLGNHEHAHIGGPRVAKFHVDEAFRLGQELGPEDATALIKWLRSWPLVALAPRAGIVATHGAPHAQITGPAQLERARLTGFAQTPITAMADTGPVGALLWARTTSTERATAFLRAVHPDARVAVFGHDPVREGHVIEREPLLCISSSFGCHDGDKVYLQWDLAEPATSAADVAARGLRRLYPAAQPVYRVS